MAGKTSGTFAAGGLLLMIVLAVIYILYVDDWYRNHAAVICTPQLKLEASPTDYCYVRASITKICSPYDGMCSWFGNDRISEFFENLSELVARWVEEAIGPWFAYDFAPQWNAFFSDEHYRLGFAAFIIAIYTYVGSKFMGLIIDWLHERALDAKD
jgi:hypothetical protein